MSKATKPATTTKPQPAKPQPAKPAKKKPAAKLAPVVLKPTKNGPVVTDAEEAKLRDLTIAYVKGDQSNQATAAEVAGAVAARFKTRETFEERKSEFQASFILPGLDKKHRDAFEASIPDGRTEEGKKPKWAAARKARTAVQKILSTYFARIRDRAFPVESAEAQPTSLRTWTDEMLARIIKRHEKDDAGSPEIIKLLRKAQEANRLGDDDGEGE